MLKQQLLPLLFLLLLELPQKSLQIELICNGSYLPPVGPGVNQLTLVAANAPVQCRLSVTAAPTAGRWYLNLEPGSGTDVDIFVRDGISRINWSGPAQLASSSSRRALTRTCEFSLNLTLRTGRLTFRASLVAPTACPPETDGWSMPWPGGCLMVSEAVAGNALNFADAQSACQRVGANLFTTAGSDPTAWELAYLLFGNRMRPGFGYWIGGRRTADGDWAYINGSRLLARGTLPDYNYDCSRSSIVCQCALYREAQIYRSNCAEQRPFICSSPPGGSSVLYPASGVPCVDCRDSSSMQDSADNTEAAESERRMYFYVLGVCAFILAVITISVLACFIHSVRRWQLDAKLAATRPPSYELYPNPPLTGDLPSDPPVYDNCVWEAELPTNQIAPTDCNSPAANQQPMTPRCEPVFPNSCVAD